MPAKLTETSAPAHAPYKLIGKNYTTPDLVAKVTGKAKYAEDYRAEGMLFAKLLLSPVPHGHVRAIDAEEALAMPGVKAILTVDDMPKPADAMTDLGQRIPANPLGERGLTNDPVYQGEPILAVCAVDELLTAAERDREDSARYREAAARGGSAGQPAARRTQRARRGQRLDSARSNRSQPRAAAHGAGSQMDRSRFRRLQRRQAAHGQSHRSRMVHRRCGCWHEECRDLVLDETFVHAEHQPPAARDPHGHGVLAERQGSRSLLHAEHRADRPRHRALAERMDPANVVVVSEYTGGGFGSKITSAISCIIPAILSKKVGAPVMMRISREEEHYIGRARPSLHGRLKVGSRRKARSPPSTCSS
jgi:xanthine dehydrogenase molybdenum-binding subunit